MNLQLIGDLVTAALVTRVFGSDVLALLRRVAAVGVRVGISELHQGHREGKR
ncbi:hypothetical protein SBI_06931 [Streptomyces bingchenggensis BCW-1]|uniref:Uncharacterized protein n=1 Tax=Streptomyces bingchenggensis (strain BCW-1) TaxID=749414 RepID=D7C1I6_STRBB|nr:MULTISPECIES: hypothetical protein [Streptomyces]ADI10051.1 hypothetical protein SBI_06931 [Streptomyces bingchenggensis BCW-1]